MTQKLVQGLKVWHLSESDRRFSSGCCFGSEHRIPGVSGPTCAGAGAHSPCPWTHQCCCMGLAGHRTHGFSCRSDQVGTTAGALAAGSKMLLGETNLGSFGFIPLLGMCRMIKTVMLEARAARSRTSNGPARYDFRARPCFPARRCWMPSQMSRSCDWTGTAWRKREDGEKCGKLQLGICEGSQIFFARRWLNMNAINSHFS